MFSRKRVFCTLERWLETNYNQAFSGDPSFSFIQTRMKESLCVLVFVVDLGVLDLDILLGLDAKYIQPLREKLRMLEDKENL